MNTLRDAPHLAFCLLGLTSALSLSAEAREPLFPQLGLRYAIGDPNRTNPISDTEGPKCVACADLNADGLADVITGNLDGTVSVLLANGGNAVHEQALFEAGGSIRAVACADFNGDGCLDVAAADITRGVRILPGDGNGALGTPDCIEMKNARALAAADCDGDGNVDLLVACSPPDCETFGVACPGVLSMLRGRGDGTFRSPEPLVDEWPGCFYDVALADLDADGRVDAIALDLPVAGATGRVLIFDGRGDGTFEPLELIPTEGRGSRALCVACVDERSIDGVPPAGATPDLLVANRDGGTVDVLCGRTDSGFSQVVTVQVGDSPRAVAAGDLDGDGLAELIVVNRNVNTISVLQGLGEVRFSRPLEFPAGTSPRQIVLGDITGDGALDAAVVNRLSEDVSIFVGRRGLAGFLVPDAFYPAGITPKDVIAEDLNGDGRPDLATVNLRSHDLRVRLSLGEGRFGEEMAFAAGYMPSCLQAADLNGDGCCDLVIAAQGTVVRSSEEAKGALVTLLGRGDGTFERPILASVSDAFFSPHWLRLADLTGDGHLDAAVAGTKGELILFRGRADGGFEDPARMPVPQQGRAITVTLGDFNNDGRIDLATSQGQVLLNDGKLFADAPVKTFTFDAPSNVIVRSWVIESADLDGDGNLDLIVTVTFQRPDPVAVFYGVGDGTFLPPDIYGGPDQGVVDIAAADMDGDGVTDLVIGNRCGANVIIMRGLGNRKFEPLETVSAYSVEGIAVRDLNDDGRPDILGAGLGAWAVINGGTVGLADPRETNLFGIATHEGIYINELMALNQGYYVVGGSLTPDWVELYNHGAEPRSLAGWTLAKHARDGSVSQWAFPSWVTVKPMGHLVVFCDDAARPSYGTKLPAPWCKTFALAREGEAVALLDPQGQQVDYVVFPPMSADVSYARFVDAGRFFCYNPLPTMGMPNVRPANLEPTVARGNPIISADGMSIGVTARPFDDVGIAYASVHFRVGAEQVMRETVLHDDGAMGDVEAADGVFSVLLPEVPAGSVIRYWLRVVDLEGGVDTYPDDPTVEEDLPRMAAPQPPGALRISELVADNETGLVDEVGRHADWLEIVNCGSQVLSLTDVGLTKDFFDDQAAWLFPPGTSLAPQERLVVFCDRDIDEGPLHAHFRLDRAGETVLLVRKAAGDMWTLLDSMTFGPLPPDTAFGRPACDRAPTILAHPTPGAPNAGPAAPAP